MHRDYVGPVTVLWRGEYSHTTTTMTKEYRDYLLGLERWADNPNGYEYRERCLDSECKEDHRERIFTPSDVVRWHPKHGR